MATNFHVKLADIPLFSTLRSEMDWNIGTPMAALTAQ